MTAGERYKFIVDVTVTSDGRQHNYRLPEWATPIADLEFLEESVRALDAHIKVVDVDPGGTVIVVASRKSITGNLQPAWPEDYSLDMDVVECLAAHQRRLEDPMVRIRKRTEEEELLLLNEIVANGVANGAEPPPSWPFTKL